MKRNIWLAVLGVALFSAQDAAAQLAGGGTGSTVETRSEPTTSVFSSRTILRGGMLSATGTYGDMPQTGFIYYTGEALESAFSEGSGATSGYYGELAQLIHLLTPHPMIGVGVELSAAVGYVDIDWAQIQDAEEIESTPDLIGDLRAGPVLSVNPVGNLIIDASYKLGTGLAAGSSFDMEDAVVNGQAHSLSDADYIEEDPAFGRSSSFGIGLRYGAISLGWEMHSVGSTRTREYSWYNEVTGDSDYLVYGLDTKASTSRLSVGLSF